MRRSWPAATAASGLRDAAARRTTDRCYLSCLAAVPAAYLLTTPRRGRALITFLFATLSLWVCWELSPKAY